MVSSNFKVKKLYKQNCYSKTLLHGLEKKKNKDSVVVAQPEDTSSKKTQVLPFVMAVEQLLTE